MQVSSSWPPVDCVRPKDTAELPLESLRAEDKGWNESMPHNIELVFHLERHMVKEPCKIISDNKWFWGK